MIKTIGIKAFSEYLKGKLSTRERHNFERSIMSDPFEADAFDGLSLLSPSEIEQDINLLNTRLNKKQSGRSPWLWIASAASVAIIISLVSIMFLFVPQQKDKKIAQLKQDSRDTIQPIKLHKKSAPIPVFEELTDVDSEDIDKPEISETTIMSMVEPDEKSTITPAVHENDVLTVYDDDVAVFEEVVNEPTQNANVAEIKAQQAESSAPTFRIRGLASRSKSKQVELSAADALQGKVNGVNISNDQPDTGTMVVKGFILDESRQPIPGASVTQIKTGKGTISNINGYFELAIPANDHEGDLLAASFIGYDTFEFNAPKDTTQIILNPNMLALDEIVVVGYGTQKEESIIDEYTSAKPLIGFSEFRKKVIGKLEGLNMPVSGQFRVVVKISISVSGSIDSIEVIRTPDESINSEIINIIKETSKWQPATKNNIPIADSFRESFRINP